jgi:hypothetical protein
MQTLHGIRAVHGTLVAYEVYLAASAARRLQWGGRSVAGAIAALLTGIALTWWAPADPSPPPSYVTVTRRHAVTCGVLRPASTGSLRLTVQGSPDPVTIPLSRIAGLAPAASCP